MKVVNIQAAKTHLSRIVDEVVEGDEVVLAKSGKPLVRLVPYAENKKPRTPGLFAGQGWEAPDCWAPGESELEASIEAPLLREPDMHFPPPPRRRVLRLLLDSHVIVWWLTSPERLSAETRAMISAPGNDLLLSAASAWELGLKVARGKLRLPENYAATLIDEGFRELPVSIAHAVRATGLPTLHGDPFDRLLVAQALEEDLILVTADDVVASYPVPIQRA
ncbi:MAG: hypothetical protein RLZZ188_3294 [Verrucomicrobiota bacterium]|jgi:prevent-host-death family protein